MLLKASLLLILLFLLAGGRLVRAADGVVTRQTTIVTKYTKYQWWLIRYYDNQPLCAVYVDHEGLPTAKEVYNNCGKDTYTLWINTPPCIAIPGVDFATTECIGLYFLYIDSQPAEKTVEVDLPPAQVWVTITDCNVGLNHTTCQNIPSLLLTGDEPLPNEKITAIHVLYDGQSINCSGDTCKVPLLPTPLNGKMVEFWADSSFGDSSEHFKALVRIIESGVSNVPGGAGWYIDVLSAQWKGAPLATCSQLWDAFPPIGDMPDWLTTPEASQLMATEEPYYYLAGRLIAQGLVDAKSCPGGGLLSNGYADACGLEKAMPQVQEWQNRFDAQIITTAKQTGVPAQLMKNLFAQESQFWPGAFKDPKEFGFGQLTDNGAETILLWNLSFYDQYCPMVLNASKCSRGYVYLDKDSQAILRGALAKQAKVDCQDCNLGVDLTNITSGINLFAQTILANCSQVSRIVYNATNRSPGLVTNYENLWRFTIANYHIGPGCLSYALYQAWARRDVMDWDHVAQYLTPPCKGVIPYVTKVAK